MSEDELKGRDRKIGERLSGLRGAKSQQAVADAMREKGHKWSQATVWSVEKGERPLRLTEADDLARVLDVHDALRLLESAEEARLSVPVYHLIRATNRARDEAYTWLGARRHLEGQLAEADWGDVSEDFKAWAQRYASLTLADLVRQVEERWRKEHSGEPFEGYSDRG